MKTISKIQKEIISLNDSLEKDKAIYNHLSQIATYDADGQRFETRIGETIGKIKALNWVLK